MMDKDGDRMFSNVGVNLFHHFDDGNVRGCEKALKLFYRLREDISIPGYERYINRIVSQKKGDEMAKIFLEDMIERINKGKMHKLKDYSFVEILKNDNEEINDLVDKIMKFSK